MFYFISFRQPSLAAFAYPTVSLPLELKSSDLGSPRGVETCQPLLVHVQAVSNLSPDCCAGNRSGRSPATDSSTNTIWFLNPSIINVRSTNKGHLCRKLGYGVQKEPPPRRDLHSLASIIPSTGSDLNLNGIGKKTQLARKTVSFHPWYNNKLLTPRRARGVGCTSGGGVDRGRNQESTMLTFW